MKYNNLVHYIFTFLLGSTLLCGCGEQHRLAVASEGSDVIHQKKVDRYVNSDGGLGEVVVSDEWQVREELRRCQSERRDVSIGLQSERKNSKHYRTLFSECKAELRLSDDKRTSCQRQHGLLEREYGALKGNSTAVREYFEARTADLESQLAIREAQCTEDMASCSRNRTDEISTLTALNDDLKSQLVFHEDQMHSLKQSYDLCIDRIPAGGYENKAQEINKLTQKTSNLAVLNDDLTSQRAFYKNQTVSSQGTLWQSSGATISGVVGVGGVVGAIFFKKMSNRLRQVRGELDAKKKESDQLRSSVSQKDAEINQLKGQLEGQEEELYGRIALLKSIIRSKSSAGLRSKSSVGREEGHRLPSPSANSSLHS